MENSEKNFNLFICRLCVQHVSEWDTLLNVFDNTEIASLPDRIKFCTSIEVTKNDGLPPHICYVCLEKLNQCFTFKNQCLQADSTLKEWVQNKSSVTETVKTVKTVKTLDHEDSYNAQCKIKDDFSAPGPEHSTTIAICGIKKFEPINIGEGNNENEESPISSHSHQKEDKILEKNTDKSKSTNWRSINLCKKNKKIETNSNADVLGLISNTENLSDDFLSQSTETQVKSNECTLFKTDDEAHVDVSTSKGQVKQLKKKVLKPKLLARRKGKTFKEKEGPKEKPSSYTCDYCHKVYPSAGGWRYHMHTVHNQNYQPFICDLCGQTFKVKKNLEGHKNSIHFRLKLQLCEVCGRGFASKYALKVHKVWHNDEKNFACDVCGIRFRTRGKLNTHKTTHGGPKNFMCHICSRDFRWKKDFEVHIRTHTGEKPFKCSHCGKAFASLTNMKKHERNDSLKLMMDKGRGSNGDLKDETLVMKNTHFLLIS